MQPIIHVENLVKRYRKADRNAVDGISFPVMPGELFALLGPNGAGKTTTISILTTMGIISIIDDRENDFSQGIFVSPISRYTIVFGKILGESLVALVQGLGIVIFALVIGLPLSSRWALLLLAHFTRLNAAAISSAIIFRLLFSMKKLGPA